MAGTLQALLLTSTGRGGRLAGFPAVPLAAGSGLVLLPLTSEVTASMGPAESVDGFYELTTGVAEWARRHSRDAAVAYLHTEFFGGNGFHAAMAWRAGQVAWGPVFTATADGEAEDHYETVADLDDLAINALLRWLGVRRAGAVDEFAAVGLDRYRATQEWAAAAIHSGVPGSGRGTMER